MCKNRLTARVHVTEALLRELHQAWVESNAIADRKCQTFLIEDFPFDFSAVDQQNFKEDAVREDIIAPILRRVGYQAIGVTRMERSRSLKHPFVMIGSKKHKINIVPDYTLFEHEKPVLVLEAKAPYESIENPDHIAQTFSYAIHPDVRCQHFALCNGRKFAFHSVSQTAPIFVIDVVDICRNWGEFEKHLLPKYLLMPVLLEFKPDFGQRVKRLGLANAEEFYFHGHFLQQLDKSGDGYFIAHSTSEICKVDCMLTLDLKQDSYESILAGLPVSQASQIRLAMSRAPYKIDLDGKVIVNCRAKLGNEIRGPHETFIPFDVFEICDVSFNESITLGNPDFDAVSQGIPRLQV